MINNLNSENLIFEIKDLVSSVENAKDEINIYCDLIKQLFLSNSNNN